MLNIRPAQERDVDAIFDLIMGLAAYEKLTDRVTGNSDLLRSHLFGSRPYAESIVAELDTEIVGFGLFFHTYSTFLTQPGLHLEDVFVRPEYRRQGIGKALMMSIAKIAFDRGCGHRAFDELEQFRVRLHRFELRKFQLHFFRRMNQKSVVRLG